MSFPVVFHPDYVIRLPEGHRFPADKFGRYARTLVADGLALGNAWVEPEEAPEAWLTLAHDPAYVAAVENGALTADIVRRIGFPNTPPVARRARLAVGGTVLASRLAAAHGLAFNAAGGSHHARRAHGAGFCVFNDVAVAALLARAEGRARRVLIIDLDVHQGDGTAQILAAEPEIFTFSLHCADNYPLHKERSDLDIELARDTGDDEYLTVLAAALPRLFAQARPELVFYLAGVDVHADDPLGKLTLTDAGLMARETLVFETLKREGVPAAVVMAGGYDPDGGRLAARHALAARAARSLFSGHSHRMAERAAGI
jgi:acetoin utilization deacetylase AcuC-like enzyme